MQQQVPSSGNKSAGRAIANNATTRGISMPAVAPMQKAAAYIVEEPGHYAGPAGGAVVQRTISIGKTAYKNMKEVADDPIAWSRYSGLTDAQKKLFREFLSEDFNVPVERIQDEAPIGPKPDNYWNIVGRFLDALYDKQANAYDYEHTDDKERLSNFSETAYQLAENEKDPNAATGKIQHLHTLLFKDEDLRMQIREHKYGLNKRKMDQLVKWLTSKGPGSDIQIKSSEGSILTFIFKSQNLVIQQYSEDQFGPKEVVLRHLLQQQSGKVKEAGDAGPQYNLSDYITCIKEIVPEYQAIILEKVVPLNELFSAGESEGADAQQKKLIEFVRKNGPKIHFDIARAIHGLYEKGLTQNDVRLDNVGIKNGNFVLFDYNAAKPASEVTINEDLRILAGSLTSKGYTDIKGYKSYMDILASAQGDVLSDKIEYLTSLTIS